MLGPMESRRDRRRATPPVAVMHSPTGQWAQEGRGEAVQGREGAKAKDELTDSAAYVISRKRSNGILILPVSLFLRKGNRRTKP